MKGGCGGGRRWEGKESGAEHGGTEINSVGNSAVVIKKIFLPGRNFTVVAKGRSRSRRESDRKFGRTS